MRSFIKTHKNNVFTLGPSIESWQSEILFWSDVYRTLISSLTHFNYFDRKQKSTAEAIRPEDKKFFKVDMKVLIVSVSLAAMVLYAFCDIILATFESDFGKIKRTSRRQTESLIFCLLLYLVPVMALFSYRFQVKHFGARNNFG